MGRHGQDPKTLERLPKLARAYEAFLRAREELATPGRIRRSTQRTASQCIIPAPMAGLLIRLPFPANIRKLVKETGRKWAGTMGGNS